MARPRLAAIALLAAVPARAQEPLEPSGRLPPEAPSLEEPMSVAPRKAAPAEAPAGPTPRGAVLEQVSGIVREVDRKTHRFIVDAAGERVALSMDRNTMVYTSAGLGTVLDVVPGAAIRAGRNADFVAYWVQVRAPAGGGAAGASRPPAQGAGPPGGSGVPAERGAPPAPPAGTGTGGPGPDAGSTP